MIESKYLNQFAKLNGSAKDSFVLRGNRLIVEILPKEEIKKGGLIVATNLRDVHSTTAENQAQLAIVLLSGNGYIDEETGEESPCDLQPGCVILVSAMSLKKYSQFPGLVDYTSETIALARETDAHMSWPSIEAYATYAAALSA